MHPVVALILGIMALILLGALAVGWVAGATAVRDAQRPEGRR